MKSRYFIAHCCATEYFQAIKSTIWLEAATLQEFSSLAFWIRHQIYCVRSKNVYSVSLYIDVFIIFSYQKKAEKV